MERIALSDTPFTSAHAIGDTVLFSCDLVNADGKQETAPPWSIQCKVLCVKFDSGKVLYDLAPMDPQSAQGFYEARPLENVDSFFVYPADTPMQKIAFSDRQATPNLNSISKVLSEIGRQSWKEIPLEEIFKAVKSQGLTPLQEDGTEWEGMLLGREGRTSIPLREDATGKTLRKYLHIQWYKLESGRYEVTSYLN